MADQQVPDQYNQIYTLAVESGIKRDGTNFESGQFTDGVWCRFQRGRPKKMGGYRTMFLFNNAIARGMIATPQNGVNYVFIGNQYGIEVFTTGTTLGLGSGPYLANILNGYSPVPLVSHSTTTFVVAGNLTTVYTAGCKVCFAQGVSPTIYTVASSSYNSGTTQTTVTMTTSFTGTATNVYLINYQFTPNANYSWQFDIQYNPAGGVLNLLASPGINLANIDSGNPTQILIGSILPDSSDNWVFQGLSDSGGQTPTYKPIVVDGGVCVLYPFIFVYGSNGFIANNNVDAANYATQSPYDWNGPLANQVNMSSSKIVKGVPTRGGTNSPSGLFWATDSLIRVSFPNTPSASTGTPPIYWRYDIVSSQISIMSSNAVVEMDGSFYWMGVDRFYVYNGQVTVLPNDMNVNYLFDNLNFTQRQKVWATKVPRYNEIWFFYPRGTATECTDAIVYNVKDKIWYDAGQAEGAQRSCGYTTEIFPSPIWADWNYNANFTLGNKVIATPSGQPAPTAYQVYLAGDQTSIFSPGDYATFVNNTQAANFTSYRVTNSVYTYGTPGYTLVTFSAQIIPAVSVGATLYYVNGGYAIWQHEFGLNKITNVEELAIYSSITSSDISWIGGTPAQDTPQAVNRRMHLRRIEPDFLQAGVMSMNILGRKFPNGPEEDSGPFYFNPDTGKIDLRIEHRLVRLQFISNTIDGNYEMGRNLITAEYGDERP
jgi:hypothetical protein